MEEYSEGLKLEIADAKEMISHKESASTPTEESGDANAIQRVPTVLESLEELRFTVSLAEERIFGGAGGVFQQDAQTVLKAHYLLDHIFDRVRALMSVTHTRLDELEACPKHNEQKEMRELMRLQLEAAVKTGRTMDSLLMMPTGGGDDEPSN